MPNVVCSKCHRQKPVSHFVGKSGAATKTCADCRNPKAAAPKARSKASAKAVVDNSKYEIDPVYEESEQSDESETADEDDDELHCPYCDVCFNTEASAMKHARSKLHMVNVQKYLG